MNSSVKLNPLMVIILSTFFGSLIWALTAWSAVGSDVFQGFTRHIFQQISRDKIDFVEAENCTIWFYGQLQKKQSTHPEIERLSLRSIQQENAQYSCMTLYPQGIKEARSAFAQTQSALSLSLTFYQFALVGDRNDNGEYDDDELKDMLESISVNYLEQEGAIQYLAKLNGKFDSVRQKVEFSVLMDGMQKLYQIGYRLTKSDEADFAEVTGENP